MKEKFTLMLENIKKDLIFMANEVEDSLYHALRALERQDKKLAEKVFRMDKSVDQQEVRIEENILSLLALHQPVATDLRFIIGALKMNNDLERIGDHAVNIARTAIQRAVEPMVTKLEDISRMGKIARVMLHDAVHSFINQNPDLAKDVCGRDDEIDALFLKVQADLIQMMEQTGKNSAQGVDLIYVARNLERIADLSTNLSEEVVFMAEAKIIRHGLGMDFPGKLQ